MSRNVALVISSEELQNWSGGLSYYINLLNILKKLQKTNLHIYTDSSLFIKNFNINKSCFVKELRCLRKGNIFCYLRKLIILLFKKDYILYCILLSDKINILSHDLWSSDRQRASVPTKNIIFKIQTKLFDFNKSYNYIAELEALLLANLSKAQLSKDVDGSYLNVNKKCSRCS